MTWRDLRLRLRAAILRRRVERELDDELQFHLQMQIRTNLGRGMPTEQARQEALRKFGPPAQIADQCRDARRIGLLEDFETDTRQAARVMARHPGFTAITALMLALGIGATTAMFSVVNAVLLRPLPFPDSYQLVWIWSIDDTRSLQQWTSFPDFLDWRAQTRTLAHIGGWGMGSELILTGRAEPQRVEAAIVTANFFTMLGVPPLLGTAGGREAGDVQDQVIVLSYGFWQRTFGGNPALIGQPVTLSERPYIVGAVMPPSFRFPIQGDSLDLWIVMRDDQFNPALRSRRDARLIEVVGRLRPDVTVEQAQGDMDVVAASLSREYPATNRDVGVRVVPAIKQVTGEVSGPLWIAFAAVMCVLLIACVNVANLLLTRVAVRRQELAVRAALGAGRWRVARQLLAESLPLAVIGGALGMLLAVWIVRVFVPLVPAGVPRAGEISLDFGVLGFTTMVALVTGVASSLAPLWNASRIDAAAVLHEGAQTTSGRPDARRLSSVLVAGQIALAMVLLAGATLFVSSLTRLVQPDPGFDPRNVLTFQLRWPTSKYRPAQAAEAFHELQTRLLAIPGVQAASVGLQLPDRGRPVLDDVLPFVAVEGRAIAPGDRVRTSVMTIQPGYFHATGIPLTRGGEFDDAHRPGAPWVAIINEALAGAYFPNQNPIGKRLTLDSWTFFGPRTLEIVGVAGDVKHRGLMAPAAPLIYLPLAQNPGSGGAVVVKTAADPLTFVPAVRAVVRSLDRDQPIYDIQTLESRIAASFGQDRFTTVAMGLMAALAVLLAAGGLYGTVSYIVSLRTREVGIRMALGAQIRDIARLTLGQGMRVALVGVALGLAGAIGLSRTVEALLFGVSAIDLFTVAIASVLLMLVAVVACWFPTHKAMRVDPVVALRCQ